MESAWLDSRLINLEHEKATLIEKGYSEDKIKIEIEQKYRSISKKGGFLCLCCNSEVEMGLPKNRRLYFRHREKKECAGTKNYHTYLQQQEASYFDEPRHRVGKAIIRTFLENQLKLNGIIVKDGYGFKQKLSIVPDFIIEFPDDRIWAVDYIAGVRKSEEFAKHLKKRKKIYLQEKIKPFFFIADYWLSKNPYESSAVLVEAERVISSKTSVDDAWDSFFEGLSLQLQTLHMIEPERYRPFNTNSLIYVDVNSREGKILRFLAGKNVKSKFVRLVDDPITLPLERLLTLNANQTDFLHFHENEHEIMDNFKKSLEEKNKELESKKEEEYTRKIKESINRWRAPIPSLVDNKNSDFNVPDIRSKEEQARDLELMKRAYQHQKSGTTTSSVEDKKTARLKEKILKYRVKSGEAYFDTDPIEWKKLVLNQFENIKSKEMTIDQLYDYLLNNGVRVNQNKKLMLYPIKEFLEYIAKIRKVKIEF